MHRFDVVRAYNHAARAHAGQFRKYSDDTLDYITHPLTVATMLSEWIDNETYLDQNQHILAAALLHDVVEDTSQTIETIEHKFGEKVAKYVWFLTDSPKFAGNRKERKLLDARRLAKAPDDVKAIKFFDNVHNLRGICAADEKFFKTYLIEKEMLGDHIDYASVEISGKKLPLELLTEDNIRRNIE